MFNSLLISDEVISKLAQFINDNHNKPYRNISISTVPNNSESPQYYEPVPFNRIDASEKKYYAIDGSYNHQEFGNGLHIGLYCAGYVCFHKGQEVKLDNSDNPLSHGIKYLPNNVLNTCDNELEYILEEFLELKPIRNFLDFLEGSFEDICSWNKDILLSSFSKLLSICQNILEWALVYEVSNRSEVNPGDIILRDGNLRSKDIKPNYLTKLAKHLKSKKIHIIAITKKSKLKMELSNVFRGIDDYLQTQLKNSYPFTATRNDTKKLCCWFEIPENVLLGAFGGDRDSSNVTYSRKGFGNNGGFGIFFATRLDYVEKLQNFDWAIADLNILDVMPNIESKDYTVNFNFLKDIFIELTHLTQEHYILGYPYPLVEVHNFVTLKNSFNDELVARIKYYLYKDQYMDNVDIENLFLDIHNYF